MFVLGGNGFVGSAVVKAAALLGYSVVSVSRRGAPAGGPGASEAWQERVQYKKGDLVADPDLLRRLLDDAKARKEPVLGVRSSPPSSPLTNGLMSCLQAVPNCSALKILLPTLANSSPPEAFSTPQ